MEELQLRKTMGGYKREDVAAYIDTLIKKYEAQLSLEQEATKAARAEADAAVKENAKLFEKLSALEAERDSVSRAVISAQREADSILEEARARGEALLREKEQEAIRMESKMSVLKSEIHTMRLQAAAALRKYEGALSELIPQEDEDEEE
ncbi:MAG: hypothetical protein E7390_06340 [Ruminococcaceae bacterium]|nr:hypothetical protein [Oscillospiraceae bacterium]